VKENWVYPGNDSSQETNQTIYAACYAQCSDDDQCKTFSSNNKTYICCLKSSIGNGGEPDPNVQSGFREGKTKGTLYLISKKTEMISRKNEMIS
jgi:hypothetical protein